MMSIRNSYFCLPIIFLLSIGLMIGTLIVESKAQVFEPILVTTDKDFYLKGETILVSGKVMELLSGVPVTFQVTDTNGNIVALEQIDVGPDKKFGIELYSGGALWKSFGTYTIKVVYGTESRTATTTFELASLILPTSQPIKGIPNQFVLRAGEQTLNDIQYQINFDFLSDGYQIKKIYKGSFDAFEQLPKGVIFYAETMSQNDERSGVVVFSSEGAEPRKGNYEVTLTANGVTNTKTVDPAWIVKLATEVINALPSLLDFTVGVEEQIEPCANIDVAAKPFEYGNYRAKFHIETENCSTHREQFRLNFVGQHNENARFDPASPRIDIPANGKRQVDLIIDVETSLADGIYQFSVTNDVIMDFLGNEWEYTSYTSDIGEYQIENRVVVPEFPITLLVLTMALIPVLIISRKIFGSGLSTKIQIL